MIVEFSPKGMIAEKGFDEKSVVACVGQPRVLQKTNVNESVTDIYGFYLAFLKRKAKEDQL